MKRKRLLTGSLSTRCTAHNDGRDSDCYTSFCAGQGERAFDRQDEAEATISALKPPKRQRP